MTKKEGKERNQKNYTWKRMTLMRSCCHLVVADVDLLPPLQVPRSPQQKHCGGVEVRAAFVQIRTITAKIPFFFTTRLESLDLRYLSADFTGAQYFEAVWCMRI
jgi:hypothetical protein